MPVKNDETVVHVLPASAGMIPVQQACGSVPTRAPRIRGDDPTRGYIGKGVMPCSPHPRG